MKLPIHWPIHFQYASTSISVDIPIEFLRHLLSNTDPLSQSMIATCIENQKVHPHIGIEPITKNFRYAGPDPHPLSDSEIFPGHQQHGVFAKQTIAKGVQLGEYVGEISFGTSNLQSPNRFKGIHCWRIPFGDLMLNISSGTIANELGFINDHRGLQPEPNVQPTWILHRGCYYFGYETIRQIEPREELLIHYGKTFEPIPTKSTKNFI